MAAAVRLRKDYGGDELRRLACKVHNGAQARRLMALAAIADGQSRAAAAAVGLMDRQTLRDWVHRFNTHGPEGLVDRKSPGRSSKLTLAQKQELRKWVEEGPETARPTWSAGGALTWPRWSRSASTWTATRPPLGGCCGDWALPTSVRGRVIPRRTSTRRRLLKKFCRAGRRAHQRADARHAGGDLVPG
jgi:transposase